MTKTSWNRSTRLTTIFGPNWVTAENRGVWAAAIDASGSIDALGAAGFGAGGITLGHDGVNASEGASLSAGIIRPEELDADMEFRAKEPNSDATLDRLIGYTNTAQDVTPPNGVFFRSVGAGNWFAVTRSANVETAQDTGQALTDVFKRFEIRMQSSNVATFLIDGVIVAVSTTNIPSAVDQNVGIEIIGSGAAPAAGQYRLTKTRPRLRSRRRGQE